MPIETDKIAKARLVAFSPENAELNIEFMYNPTEISFTRTLEWKSDTGNRGETLLPKVNFSGVSPYKFTLSGLLFDTYETKESVMDKYIQKIKKGVEAPPNTPDWRPPVYTFEWGDHKYYHCVVTSLTYKLTMFLADGKPVRAMVDIALQEVDPKNTSGSSKSESKGAARTTDPKGKSIGPLEPPAVQKANRLQNPLPRR